MPREIPNTFSRTKYPLYERLYTPKKDTTAREVDAIVGLIGLAPQDRTIDLCCGSGRHALLLARRGLQADGIDISSVAIGEARQMSMQLPSLAPRPTFFLGDVRQMPALNPEMKGTYDVALNLFSSFGYYENDQEQLELLRAANSMLKPEGKFLLDIPNKTFIVNNFESTSEFTEGDLTARVTRELDATGSRIRTTTVVSDGKNADQLNVAMNLYDYPAIAGLLEQSGFEIADIRRDFAPDAAIFDPADPSCHRMLILAKKA